MSDRSYDPCCEICHARPKMDRSSCCEECWYSGRYAREVEFADERFPKWYTDALDRERIDRAYRELDEVLDV